jgi:Fe-S-cluster containining protein
MKETEKIFNCTRCGYCCHGQTTVSLDADDQERMCRALHLSREEVAARFWRITGNVVQMKVVDGHCIFYEDGCTVHDGRPWRCAEWPLHPSIMKDESNFSAIADSCPGIKREVGYDEFCAVLRRILAQNSRARC